MSHDLRWAVLVVVLLVVSGAAPTVFADLIDEEEEELSKLATEPPSAPAAAMPATEPRVKEPRRTPKHPSTVTQDGPKSPAPQVLSEPVLRTTTGSALSPKGGGAKSDKEQAKLPVAFKSKGARGLREKGTFELMQDVVITQGDMKMQADHAQLFGDEKAKDIMRVIANGDVKMFMVDADSGEKIRAFGDKVIFDNKTRTIVLEGNARLWRGSDLVRGKTILYEMDSGWIRADRVAGEVYPDTEKAKP